MKRVALLSALLLIGCTASVGTPDHQSMEGMTHNTLEHETSEVHQTVVVEEVPGETESEIAFVIKKDGEVLREFGVNHEREMHFIVVRDDLRYFYHLHPERDSDGTWRTDVLPQKPGTYWMYADFIEKDRTPHTLRFEHTYAGESGDYGVVPSTEQVKTVMGYTVTLNTVQSADGVQLHYDVRDAENKPVAFENYLGAKGHAILVSKSGDFIHAHPFTDYAGYMETDQPVFMTHGLKDPFYRIFTQFKINGQVILAVFDWQS